MEPGTVTVIMANAQQVSSGYASPGNQVQLPAAEGYGLVRSGPTQVVSVP